MLWTLVPETPAMGQSRSLVMSIEATQGQYQDDVTHESTSSSFLCTFCGNNYSVRRVGYYHRYALAGGSVAYQLRPWSAQGLQTVGLGIRVGQQQVGFRPLAPEAPFDANSTTASTRNRLYDFNPYLTGRFGRKKWAVGYRVGLHLGQLRYTATVLADSSLDNEWLAPDAQLWVGVRRVLFAQFDSGLGQLALGNHTTRFSLGSGLGADDARFLLVGLAVARHEPRYGMGFLSANIPLGHTGLQVEPYAASNFKQHYQLSILMHYQIPLKTQTQP
ncbi:hypothetical protein [Hymenobacter armeniacus]|uniref:Type IX secretion system membrane protein PorP/SprF n=1 Tax=Hymenobacter armeniacus TaxID=2771358 RepID=A0ABR8JNU0_9BACT|nr:hypothetical protein [Hymenobacter armeniacus]MBD2720710.1 hypothetical protein [Hymenobacter armeniacus]